jgi:hypothetical protein
MLNEKYNTEFDINDLKNNNNNSEEELLMLIDEIDKIDGILEEEIFLEIDIINEYLNKKYINEIKINNKNNYYKKFKNNENFRNANIHLIDYIRYLSEIEILKKLILEKNNNLIEKEVKNNNLFEKNNNNNNLNENKLIKIKLIICGFNHTFISTINEKYYFFGNNEYGQLGIGNNENKLIPTEFNLSNENRIIKYIAKNKIKLLNWYFFIFKKNIFIFKIKIKINREIIRLILIGRLKSIKSIWRKVPIEIIKEIIKFI